MSDEPMTGTALKLHQIRARVENGHGADFIRWMRGRSEEDIDSLHAFLHPDPTDEQKESVLEELALRAEQIGKPELATTIRREKPDKPGQGGGRGK